MSTEPGWYHAQGDPPGTVRRWNGAGWIGFALMQPTAEGTTPGSSIGVAPFQAYAGQVPLKGFAIAVQLALIVVALADVFFGIALLQLGAAVSDINTPSSLYDVAPLELDRLAIATLVAQLLTFGTGILMIIWFALAYRNMSLWNNNRRGMAWTVLAWIVPFVSLVRPMTMMMELAENSPRPDRRPALSPVPIMVWWIMWLFAQFGMVFFFGSVGIDTHPSNLLKAMGALQILSVVPAGLAAYAVQGITDAQEGRRVPSPAQRAQMQQDAEISAFDQTQAGVTSF